MTASGDPLTMALEALVMLAWVVHAIRVLVAEKIALPSANRKLGSPQKNRTGSEQASGHRPSRSGNCF